MICLEEGLVFVSTYEIDCLEAVAVALEPRLKIGSQFRLRFGLEQGGLGCVRECHELACTGQNRPRGSYKLGVDFLLPIVSVEQLSRGDFYRDHGVVRGKTRTLSFC